ncbi:PREDICTED: uncharacterized protein LOC107348204, partial [Acropora digitifera]|uniref:uncharacterized protein LOC107348204 n=1 Tax=Acropora digitifera TaxID=70779 RepID=UPI00077B16BE
IFSTDFWSTSHQVSYEVALLMDKLRSTVLASRAPGTSLNYTRIFNRWRSFATEVLGIIDVFPVEPIHCALFLQYLLDSTKSVSTINCAFYAFKWLHDLAGVGSPTSHPTVVAVKEGFLRFSELSLIRAKDIKFSNGFISVFIEKSKADQLREDSDEYIFRPISASNSCKLLVSVNKAISYSTYRQFFKKSFRDIVPDITNFSTHSARSGGATSAANSGIPERNFQRHGRWASVSAKNTYIKDSLASRLDVSKSLSL